ncbi:MAG TPA: radical SAM protein [Thermodesulfobacteriota bacterium]|nr:radical SAM protein [Thermodesulfobacteriota bacterium]
MESTDGKVGSPGGPLHAYIDGEGRLVFPRELADRYGLKAGGRVRLDEMLTGIRLRRPVSHLTKVYVEPTNMCNLECRTCIRNDWDESPGMMTGETFKRILGGLRSFSPAPTVFFGGFGEPLSHPGIIDMIGKAKSLGGPVELVTNGTLLSREISRKLIGVGLDRLWISLDGANPESYADVRLGAALPEVLGNLAAFRQERWRVNVHTPELNIVFVAMKRNIADLPAMYNLVYYLGAKKLLVTNLVAYTPEMRREILYERVSATRNFQSFLTSPDLQLPRFDLNETTREPLYRVLRASDNVSLSGGAHLGEAEDFCPFVQNGATAVRWDGKVSPCLPLLRDHSSHGQIRYGVDAERFSRGYHFGDVAGSDLGSIWNSPEYLRFREKVQDFDFSFCTSCGGCEMAEKNEQDCFGNTFPTCGGCLWGQGIIRCP